MAQAVDSVTKNERDGIRHYASPLPSPPEGIGVNLSQVVRGLELVNRKQRIENRK